MELVDALEVLGLGDQQQLGVAARADEREGLQQVAVGEVLAGRHELALVALALLGGQPPPRRIDLQERVLDEVARAHAAIIAAPGRARPVTRSPADTVRSPCGSPSSRRTPGPIPAVSRATSRRSRRELAADGHEPRILAPFDPDDAPLGAPAPRRAPAAPSGARGLRLAGRTVGIPANGAVSNLSVTPHAVATLRRELRDGRLRRRPHPRAGRARRLLGRALLGRRAAARRHVPHLLRERAHQRHRRRPARRAPAHEPAARAHRRLRSRRLDRAALLRRQLPRSSPTACTCSRAPESREPAGRRSCASCSSARPSSARACPCCCAAFEALREHVPATLHARRRERGRGRAHDARRLAASRRSARSPRRRSCAGCARPTCCARPR